MRFIQRLAFVPVAASLAFGMFGLAGSVRAVVIEGFELGTGTVFGDASRVGIYGPTGGVVPPQGSFQLLLTTFSTLSPGDGAPISGTNAQRTATLETNLGLAAGTIRNSNVGGSAGNGFEGSAYTLTISLNAGDVFRFQYDFMTVEDPAQIPFHPDFAFFSVRGAASSYSTLIDASAALTVNANLTSFNFESGYRTVNFTALTSGSYTFSIGVMDAGTVGTLQSGLLLDNIQVIAIPEASTLAFALIGGVGAVGLIRRRRTA